MKFSVTITETLQKSVEVEAQSRAEAESIAEKKWMNEECVLTSEDFIDVSYEAKEARPEKMRVVLLEPGKLARAAEIGTKLEDLQRVVGGNIEAAYYFEEPVCMVVNEEGKINGLPLNRGVRDNGKLVDIIAGTAFICDCSGENFGSLSDAQIKKYVDEFKFPEQFFKRNNEIQGIKFNPNRAKER